MAMSIIKNPEHLRELCDVIAVSDPNLREVIDDFGYPPLWTRPNTLESCVKIIIEQQVSLASSQSAFARLSSVAGDFTPERLLDISDGEYRASYISRQKRDYIRGFAEKMIREPDFLHNLEQMDDDQAHEKLTELKGVGEWTANIYFIEVLHRVDIFPMGDVAARNTLYGIKNIEKGDTKTAEKEVEKWRPYRTVATLLLWQRYLGIRGSSSQMLAETM